MSKSDVIITAENLNDKAYAEIKNRIFSKELEPGMRLVDSQLAEKYGISRTPVRDAIRKLAEEGFVVSDMKKKGYFVFNPSKQDIDEIYELRLIIERAVVTKLISEMMPAQPDYYARAIEKIEENLINSIKSGTQPFKEYDKAFHGSLIGLSNNSRVISTYYDNLEQAKLFREKTSSNKEGIKNSNRLHIELVRSIKNMNLKNALRCISEHIELAKKHAFASLSSINK